MIHRIYKHIGIFVFTAVFILCLLLLIFLAGGDPKILIPKL